MEKKLLTVEIPENLLDRLHQMAVKLKSRNKTYAKEMESLVEAALIKHLDELERSTK